jgi:hypothetical protein
MARHPKVPRRGNLRYGGAGHQSAIGPTQRLRPATRGRDRPGLFAMSQASHRLGGTPYREHGSRMNAASQVVQLPRSGPSHGPTPRSGSHFRLIESAQHRWRMVNSPTWWRSSGPGAAFVNGKLVERPEDEAPTQLWDGSGGFKDYVALTAPGKAEPCSQPHRVFSCVID